MTEHWFVSVMLQIVVLKNKKWTYRVNSSVNCVWSGGKNFTTKRRMVFFGPECRNQQVNIHVWSFFWSSLIRLVSKDTGGHAWISFTTDWKSWDGKWGWLTSDLFQCWLQQIQPHLKRKADGHLSLLVSSHYRKRTVSMMFDWTGRTAELQGFSGRTDVPHSPAFCDGLRTPVQNSLPLSGSSGHKPDQTALYHEIVAKTRGKRKWQTD